MARGDVDVGMVGCGGLGRGSGTGMLALQARNALEGSGSYDLRVWNVNARN